jgi:hypothetical protein
MDANGTLADINRRLGVDQRRRSVPRAWRRQNRTCYAHETCRKERTRRIGQCATKTLDGGSKRWNVCEAAVARAGQCALLFHHLKIAARKEGSVRCCSSGIRRRRATATISPPAPTATRISTTTTTTNNNRLQQPLLRPTIILFAIDDPCSATAPHCFDYFRIRACPLLCPRATAQSISAAYDLHECPAAQRTNIIFE